MFRLQVPWLVRPGHRRHYMQVVDVQPYKITPVVVLPITPPSATVVLRKCLRCDHVDSIVLKGEWTVRQVQGWGAGMTYPFGPDHSVSLDDLDPDDLDPDGDGDPATHPADPGPTIPTL